MSKIEISNLYIYPVKSCRPIELKQSAVDAFGLQHDRRWMVVDANGEMLTQRKLSRMCLIQPQLTESGLVIKAPGCNDLVVDTPTQSQQVKVKVWEDECQAYDAGEKAASWFSHFLSLECRLVYFPDNEVRQVDTDYANPGDKTAFSDGFPLLLISQASLDDLNSRMNTPVAMTRFRPNIVVTGCTAYAEDEWKLIKAGELEFRLVKPCSRCVIPSINIETAKKEDEPLRTLVSYRKRDNKIFFGQNIIADGIGEIRQGMPVELIS